MPQFFATCARGLEPALELELQRLQAAEVLPGRGGVSFSGDQKLFYSANLWLRTAVRVLWPILKAPVASTDELYQAVQTVDWSDYMSPDHTLAVDANVRDSAITHSKFAALRVKDAICDQFRQRVGRRPSVDPETPMVGLNLHIHRNEMTLSRDGSGESLHKRGYRPILTKAPLNEALAAGLILLSDWDGKTPLVDPMCGSGTLAIEASWIAIRRPPGLTRKRFGFQGWPDFDVRRWTEIRDEARAGMAKELPAPIFGMDLRSDVVGFAASNARAAGVGHLLDFRQGDVRDLMPPSDRPGTLICNPPYGERLTDPGLKDLYRTMGQRFKDRWAGWQCVVFTGSGALARFIDLPVTRRLHLFNGRIPCQLLEYRPQ